jgi:AraC-like DNA-binding protein
VWLARALALAGLEPAPAPPRAAALRAGTPMGQRAVQRLHELAQSGGEPDPDARLLRNARALELLAIAALARPEEQPQPLRRRRSARRSALALALGRLGDEPLQGVTLSSFAARFGLSIRQASRLVRESLGTSFGEYTAELRLSRARLLLASSELPVIEVAAEAHLPARPLNQLFRAESNHAPRIPDADAGAGAAGAAVRRRAVAIR